MEPKVEDKLIQNLSQFINLPLKYINLSVEKELKTKKDLLILELTFSDQGVLKTMVLLLDKEYTEGNYKELAEKLTL